MGQLTESGLADVKALTERKLVRFELEGRTWGLVAALLFFTLRFKSECAAIGSAGLIPVEQMTRVCGSLGMRWYTE